MVWDMSWIAIIIVGGVLGWLASMVMKTDAHQGIFLNIGVGIVGALLAGFLLSPLLGIPTINGISLGRFAGFLCRRPHPAGHCQILPAWARPLNPLCGRPATGTDHLPLSLSSELRHITQANNCPLPLQ